MRLAIVVHGGAGATSLEAEEGCRHAAKVGMDMLLQGASALDAAVQAILGMEDSGVFNAGPGSHQRVSGKIEMDAAVGMSDGRWGGVGAVSDVRNPVLLAVAVMQQTPHSLLTGQGAREFARQLGLPLHPGPTPRAMQRHRELIAAIRRGEVPGWTVGDLAKLGLPQQNGNGALDTVGAIALDAQGGIACGTSTGGRPLRPEGGVGDGPIFGAGFQIDGNAAALATGHGEEIVAGQGSGRVHQFIRAGLSPQRACQQVAEDFPPNIPVGFIALTRDAIGIAANCPMASHSITE